MSAAKVIEIIASSTVSFDDAIKQGVAEACKTLKGVSGVWIKDQKVLIKDNAIFEYRVGLKITFVLS